MASSAILYIHIYIYIKNTKHQRKKERKEKAASFLFFFIFSGSCRISRDDLLTKEEKMKSIGMEGTKEKIKLEGENKTFGWKEPYLYAAD